MDIENAIAVIRSNWPVTEHAIREIITLCGIIGKIDPESIANRWGGDSHRTKKAMREIRLFLNMKEQVKETGLPFNAVRWNTLFPLLDAAALNDETEPGGEDMFKRWASLLANASVDPDSVPPAFPEILRQLTPADAKFFEGLIVMQPSFSGRLSYGQLQSVFQSLGLTIHQLSRVADPRSQIGQEIEEDRRKLLLSIQNLIRLSLMEKDFNLDIQWDAIASSVGRVPGGGSLRLPSGNQKVEKSYSPTATGRAFHKACQPPVKQEKQI